MDLAPSNTTLTVEYLVGGGGGYLQMLQHNHLTIPYLQVHVTFFFGTNLDSTLQSTVRNSFSIY